MIDAAARTRPAIEVIPDRLYALGGLVELDGRISWGPKDAGFQPINAYLLPGAHPPALVDTGLAVHRTAFAEQLKSLLPSNSHLDVFLTRSEHDCVGNVGLVMAEYDAGRLDNFFTGGGFNPFDGFEDATDRSDSRRNRTQLTRVQPGERSGELEVIDPPFRVLGTFWAFHSETKTLFTSDLFGHTSLTKPGMSVVLDGASEDSTTAESIIPHLLSKFFWLDGARTTNIRNGIAGLFDRYDVEVIAPTHGRILQGREVVHRHIGLLDQALSRLDGENRSEVRE